MHLDLARYPHLPQPFIAALVPHLAELVLGDRPLGSTRPACRIGAIAGFRRGGRSCFHPRITAASVTGQPPPAVQWARPGRRTRRLQPAQRRRPRPRHRSGSRRRRARARPTARRHGGAGGLSVGIEAARPAVPRLTDEGETEWTSARASRCVRRPRIAGSECARRHHSHAAGRARRAPGRLYWTAQVPSTDLPSRHSQVMPTPLERVAVPRPCHSSSRNAPS